MPNKVVTWNDKKIFGPATSPDGLDEIAEGDWRDPAILLLAPEEGYGTAELDGVIYLQDSFGRHIDTQDFFQQVHKEGRRVIGALVGADRQSHN